MNGDLIQLLEKKILSMFSIPYKYVQVIIPKRENIVGVVNVGSDVRSKFEVGSGIKVWCLVPVYRDYFDTLC
jgi:hypothetical protein